MKMKNAVNSIPVVKNLMPYLMVVIGFLVLLRTPLLAGVSNPELFLMGYLGFFLIFSVTVGKKEMGPFYNKGGSLINLIAMTGMVYFFGILAESVTGSFLSANDPQLLDQLTYPLTATHVVHELARYSLVGIGEEIFKFCLFLILYGVLVRVMKNRMISCIVSVLVTSFFFGLLHMNYNFDQWLNITLIIGSGTVVYFYFLFKYRTIVPLMLAHALQDFLVTMEHTEGLSGIYMLFLTGIVLCWFIARFGLGYKLKVLDE